MNKFCNFLIEHKWFFISLILAVLLALFRFNHGVIQQDNYVGYAQAFPSSVNKISFFDSRLFPGLPILIYLITFFVRNFYLAGYLITFLSFIGSYFLLYKITNSKLSILPLIFPPVMLNQVSLIATEIPVIFFILLSLFFFNRKKYALAIFISAFGFWIRAVAIIPGIIIFIYLLYKNGRNAIKYLPYLLLPVTLLSLFNLHFFGLSGIFHQFAAYRQLGVGTLGIVQIFTDIPRAWRWGWYRIFASGVFYFSLSVFFLGKVLANIKNRVADFDNILSYILLASLIFIFSVNSVPFLENLGRYLAPTIPLFWLILYKKFDSKIWVYVLLPISFLVVLF